MIETELNSTSLELLSISLRDASVFDGATKFKKKEKKKGKEKVVSG